MLPTFCFFHQPVQRIAKALDRLFFISARDGGTIHDQAIEFLPQFADLAVVSTLEELERQQLLCMNTVHLANDCE